MRALVLSDIHGEESQLRWMLEETWKMTGKIDGYFFLGDGVDDFAQAENFIRRRDPDALMLDVRGNNDFCCPNAPYYRVTDFGGGGGAAVPDAWAFGARQADPLLPL